MPEKEKIKILHITPWFPTQDRPNWGIFIQRHIAMVRDKFDQDVLHLHLEGKSWIPRWRKSTNTTTIELRALKVWRIREIIQTLCLIIFLLRKKAWNNYDVVNVHIAYPTLVHYSIIRRLLPPQIIINEHWSIYHFHFYSNKSLRRIKKIFGHGITVCPDSHALGRDIAMFSGRTFPVHVIRNAIDISKFKSAPRERMDYYFMAASWAPPKDPLDLLRDWLVPNNNRKLIIAGEGPLWPEMKQYIALHDQSKNIELLGWQNENQLAMHLGRCKALIHPSNYECASIIISEAICTGTPVITKAVGGIPEFVNERNGIFKSEHESWLNAVERFEKNEDYNHIEIANEAHDIFSPENIKAAYVKILSNQI
jgi:glycosyltransferase involved in cell wall biosynthesis